MEDSGLSTVVLTPMPEFHNDVGIPRSAAIEYPFGRPVGQVNDIDGIGISFGTESWVLIRASNTGPKIRVIVEADSGSRAEELLTIFHGKLEEKLQKLLD